MEGKSWRCRKRKISAGELIYGFFVPSRFSTLFLCPKCEAGKESKIDTNFAYIWKQAKKSGPEIWAFQHWEIEKNKVSVLFFPRSEKTAKFVDDPTFHWYLNIEFTRKKAHRRTKCKARRNFFPLAKRAACEQAISLSLSPSFKSVHIYFFPFRIRKSVDEIWQQTVFFSLSLPVQWNLATPFDSRKEKREALMACEIAREKKKIL